MKKLLIVIESLCTGGAEKSLVNFIKNFYNQYDCYVLVYTKRDNFYAKEIEKLATVRYVLPKCIPRMAKIAKFIPSSLLYKLTVKRIFRNVKFDIELAYLEGIATKIISGSKLDSNKISWVHCDFATNHWCKNYYINHNEERAAYQKYNSILFVTKAQAESFSKYWNIHDNLYIIPNLLDIESIEKLSKENMDYINKPYICSVGSLKPVKGFELLIDSFKVFSMKNKDCHLYILGKGYLERKLRDKIKEYQLENRVHLLGFQPNPYKYIQNSIGLIQTSVSESFGYVLLEAAILGKNVVATKTVGSIEIKKHYYDDLKLVDHSIESIVSGLEYLVCLDNHITSRTNFDNSVIINNINKRLNS